MKAPGSHYLLIAAGAIGALVGYAHPLSAQCPDGSPPPCGAPTVRAAPPPTSIAVLYFDDLSRDSSDAYLADGLTEELISRLGEVSRLEVRSRHESQRVRGRRGMGTTTLGSTLGVAYVLSGTVQADGSRLRVTAELMRSANGARVWGDVIDRAGTNALDVQGEIATAVATAVIGELLPSERTVLVKRATRDSVAYNLYLRGRFLVGSYDTSAIRLGIELYRQAVARDSTFAAAYAGLAEAWTFIADNSLPPRVAMAQARAAAERAIAMDSSIGLAYVPLGTWAIQMEFSYARAESLARRAIAVDRNLPAAHLLLGLSLLLQGRRAEALNSASQAWRLDSLSNTTAVEYLAYLYFAGEFTEAMAIAARIRRRDPIAGRRAASIEALTLLARRECGAAKEVMEAVPPADRTQRGTAALALAYACLGQRDETMRILTYFETQSRIRYIRPSYFADIHAALGDVDESFAALEQAYEIRDWNIFHLLLPARVWWREPLRADPRFQSLVERMNLTELR